MNRQRIKLPWPVAFIKVVLLFLLLTSGWLFTQPLAAQMSGPPIIIHDLSLVDSTTAQAEPGSPNRLATIDLYDGGTGITSLQGLVLLTIAGEDQEITAVYDLSGYSTDEDGFFYIGGPDAFLPIESDVAADGIALVTGESTTFVIGKSLGATPLLDSVLFATDVGTVRSSVEFSAAQIQSMAQSTIPNATIPGATIPETTIPSATIPSAIIPGATIPQPAAQAEECGTEATFIHAIQGNDKASLLIDTVVTIEGIVVGDFQDTRTQLRGFFVQEETSDFDDDRTTSEGIYIHDNGFGVDVAAGDLVRVRGQVYEYRTLTELKRIEAITICGQNNSLEPVAITLPETFDGELEQYEGMLVRVENEMTVAQTYFLGRYGQMTLAAEGRAYQPTNLHPPGSPEAIAVADANARRLLVLDDGRDIRALGDNPNPVPYLGPPPATVIRAGDTVTDLVGVIDYGRINSAPKDEVGLDYRFHPVEPPIFTVLNERNATPPSVDNSGSEGTLKVAGFNVLNYFNGDGNGSGFPTTRGAKSAAEFERQQAKIMAALVALDADIVGLMEIENDGYGAESAIQDLVDTLNLTLGDGTYAAIDPGLDQLGGDAIAVGLIYDSATVTPVGAAATLDIGAFDQALADFGRSRQPLAQTFEDANGERFTVVVNHFKSKRPSGDRTGGNIDSGDGAGAWNERRTEAAEELAAWLATDPTGSGDPDVLILGDLNAYAKETPIAALEAAGYVNLIAEYNGVDAYSFVFDGQLGYLDHALASNALLSQVTGTVDWHINADEPKVLDYGIRFNPPGYYSADPFRASDHDPVLVGLNLDTAAGEESDEESPNNEPLTHIVLPGETLSSIARRYSVRIATLAEANNLRFWSRIYPNQRFTVPPVANDVRCVRTIYSNSGESFAQLAERFGAYPQRLAVVNQIDDITATVDGKPICLPEIWRR